jgi:hypothetical protein
VWAWLTVDRAVWGCEPQTRSVVDQVHLPSPSLGPPCTRCTDQCGNSTSPSPTSQSCSCARHHRHGGREQLPLWLSSPFLLRTTRSLPRRNDLAPPLHLYWLGSERMTSPWPRAGHGERALGMFAVACSRAPSARYRGAWFRYVGASMYVTLRGSKGSALVIPWYGKAEAMPVISTTASKRGVGASWQLTAVVGWIG